MVTLWTAELYPALFIRPRLGSIHRNANGLAPESTLYRGWAAAGYPIIYFTPLQTPVGHFPHQQNTPWRDVET